jgi:hypothetical protein
MEAEIYVGATGNKRLCWEQAKMFVESPYQILLYAKWVSTVCG